MIHRPTIEWLKQKVGGHSMKGTKSTEKARQPWYWVIKSIRSRALLRRILPYMVTKADQARVALELAETIFWHQVRGQVAEKTHAKRRELGATLRALKKEEWPC